MTEPPGVSAEPSDDLRRLVHDLRSPLAVIEGFARLLDADHAGVSDAQRADYVARIRTAAAEMTSLLDAARR
jgi:signal transduction histidine kinase